MHQYTRHYVEKGYCLLLLLNFFHKHLKAIMNKLHLLVLLPVTLILGHINSIEGREIVTKYSVERGDEVAHSGGEDKRKTFHEKLLKALPDLQVTANSNEAPNQQKNDKIQAAKIEPACHKNSGEISVQTFCLQKYFMFRGQPLHPKIIQDFMTGLSDNGDQVVAINLEDSQGANRYCCDEDVSFSIDKNGIISAKADLNQGGWIQYRYHGIVNGLFIVEVMENTGGSGLFGTLLILRATQRYYLQETSTWDLKKQSSPNIFKSEKPRLHLNKIGKVLLGDRQPNTISVINASLIINGKKIDIPDL